jgi:hypothetical protein
MVVLYYEKCGIFFADRWIVLSGDWFIMDSYHNGRSGWGLDSYYNMMGLSSLVAVTWSSHPPIFTTVRYEWINWPSKVRRLSTPPSADVSMASHISWK